MISALTGILSRPKTVVMLMLVMIFAGAYSYITIPKEAQPDIDVPVYFVSVTQPGISPRDAERLRGYAAAHSMAVTTHSSSKGPFATT